MKRRSTTTLAAGALAAALVLGACGGGETASGDGSTTTTTTSATTTASETATVAQVAAGSLFDATAVHNISLEIDQAALTEMLQTYVDTGAKDWISATVTIDGQTFQNVGIKLKGNSSLMGVTVDSAAEDLPWRIRLDKYVDGQNLDGYTDVTVRSNSTETSINEAVALDLLRDAGLASEQAVETSFSVNGSQTQLRLTVQNLNDDWVEANFPDAGSDSVLYKAESDGNWSFQGEDADYSAAFEIEAGADNYAPLIELLDLVNNGTSEQIAERLPQLVDIDSFATYLAYQELIDNFDDIDGPGNNSYLFWDSATGKFTVVAWDHNLAFGQGPGGGMPGGGDAGAMPVPGGAMPDGGAGQFGGNGGPMNRSNPLVEAFLANAEWAALKEQALTDLQTSLIDSGALTASLDRWTQVATASGLVDTGTVSTEADRIRAYSA